MLLTESRGQFVQFDGRRAARLPGSGALGRILRRRAPVDPVDSHALA
jgi:hypothetical protein